jgi:hypothetical protein
VRFVPQHRFLTDDEALAVAMGFRRRHPRRLWVLSKVLGWGDLRRDDAVRAFVERHPFVALRPAGVPSQRADRAVKPPGSPSSTQVRNRSRRTLDSVQNRGLDPTACPDRPLRMAPCCSGTMGSR